MSQITPPPAGDPNAENSTIQLMRQQIDAANQKAAEAASAKQEAEAARAALETKLQTIERAKLDETERLRLEKEDADNKVKELTPLQDQVGKYASTFEKLYNDQIAALPADKQETAKALSAVGNWAERFESLQKVGSLIGPAPVVGGTVTKPMGVTPAPGASPDPQEPAAPLKPAEIKRMGWTHALSNRPATAPMQPKKAA